MSIIVENTVFKHQIFNRNTLSRKIIENKNDTLGKLFFFYVRVDLKSTPVVFSKFN